MVDDGWQVPREVISKYYKLNGDIDHADGNLEKALESYLQALTIDPAGAKVKTKIDLIRKKLEKAAEATSHADRDNDD